MRIEGRRSREPKEKMDICDSVHAAMKEALLIPQHDRHISSLEHDPQDFTAPPGKTENYTLVEITLFQGRSMEAKRTLYQAIVRNLGSLGIAPEDVFIVLIESPPENWGIRGGIPASEVDLGFRIDV